MKTYVILSLLVISFISSCSDNDPFTINDNKTGALKIKFDHIVNGKKLTLNTFEYKNGSDETFNISLLKYFVSNIKLKTKQGQYYAVPHKESFFLIDMENSNSLSPVLQVPENEYTEVEFNIGIDSMTNTWEVSERQGILDPTTNDMYWGWNTGYIFFKLEGTSAQAITTNGLYKFHIGLYGGYNSPTVNNNRIVKVDLQKAGIAKVQKNLSSDIHLMVDIGKVFDAKHTIRIQDTPTIMTSGPHSLVADNYAIMFTHDHTHNFQKITHE